MFCFLTVIYINTKDI